MNVLQDRVLWLTLLFRGSKSSYTEDCDAQSDDYIGVFKQSNLAAIKLPILEFSYKNLDCLKCLLQNLQPNTKRLINGLIITSPRVVEAFDLAMQQLGGDRDKVICHIDERFVFVVGEKSGEELESKLGLGYNLESTRSGNGKALADYIRAFCDNHPSAVQFNLIYPKGSLTDGTIENTLRDSRVKLNSVVAYETKVNSSIESDIVEHFRNLTIPDDTRQVMLNHTFFSPSGVDGFRQIDPSWYKDLVQKCIPNTIVQFCYSAIGKTTEAALIRNQFEVFSVAEKPNAACLLKSLKDKISYDL